MVIMLVQMDGRTSINVLDNQMHAAHSAGKRIDVKQTTYGRMGSVGRQPAASHHQSTRTSEGTLPW